MLQESGVNQSSPGVWENQRQLSRIWSVMMINMTIIVTIDTMLNIMYSMTNNIINIMNIVTSSWHEDNQRLPGIRFLPSLSVQGVSPLSILRNSLKIGFMIVDIINVIVVTIVITVTVTLIKPCHHFQSSSLWHIIITHHNSIPIHSIHTASVWIGFEQRTACLPIMGNIVIVSYCYFYYYIM